MIRRYMQHSYILSLGSHLRMEISHHEKEAQARLDYSNGRSTPVRISVLSLFLNAKSALPHQELEQSAKEQGLSFDRVTLYRALDWLVDQGMAHKILGIDRSWRYNALTETSVLQHAHFHCTNCNHVYCLEKLQPTLLYNLPADYTVEEVELNLQGSCPDCLKNN